MLRGGALKPTANPHKLWAHIVCAVTIPEVSFGSTESKEPILLSSLPRSRYRLVSHPRAQMFSKFFPGMEDPRIIYLNRSVLAVANM